MRAFLPQIVYRPGSSGSPLLAAGGEAVTVYRDAALTQVEVDLQLADGTPKPDGRVIVDATSRTPRLQVPGGDEVPTTLYARPDGSTVVTPIFSNAEEALAALEEAIADFYADASGTYIATLGLANGADDTAMIQAALDAARAAGGGYIVGLAGQTYRLSESLTMSSNTTLDMTGCRVLELGGSDDHMVQTYAFAHPVGSSSDGAIALGSNVLTTALGATAVLGQSVVIAGAGGNGLGPLVGIVVAKTAGTITLGTVDGRDCKATATVAGASVTLHTRDSRISVRGGWWDLGANLPSPFGVILGYHVDHFVADLERFTAQGTSRGVGVADVTNYWIRVQHADTESVVVQITGPAAGGHIDYVEGRSTADDLVALCGADYIGPGATGGDIIGCTIGTIKANDTLGTTLKVLAGAGRRIDAVKVGALLGTSRTTVCYVGDDPSSPSTVGGTYGTLDLGLIDVVSTGGGLLYLVSPEADSITATLHHDPLPSVGGNAVGVGGFSVATIKQLHLRGVTKGATAGFINIVSATAKIDQLILDAVVMEPDGSGFAGVVCGAAATVKDAVLRDCQGRFHGQTQYAVQFTAGTLNRVHIDGGSYVDGANLVNNQGATGPIIVVLSAPRVSGFGRLAGLFTAATVVLDEPHITGMGNNMIYIQGGALDVAGGYVGTPGAVDVIQRAAAEVIKVNSHRIPVDLSILTGVDGALVTNSNAGLSCGTGLCVYKAGGAGNGWKRLYDGATY